MMTIGDIVRKLHMPARYLDEIVHASINIPSEWLVKKGLSRTEQSFALSMATYFSIVLPFFKDAFIHTINPHPPKSAAGEGIFYELTLLFANMGETTLEATRRPLAIENGQAMTEDLYTLILRDVRPYILTAASLGIYFSWDENPLMTKISVEAIPWIFSMYTRDTHTGGLLQEAKSKFKELAMYLVGRSRVCPN